MLLLLAAKNNFPTEKYYFHWHKQVEGSTSSGNNNSNPNKKKEIYEISRVLLIIHTNTTVPVFAGVYSAISRRSGNKIGYNI